MLEGGATHLGVATDHVIESFATISGPDTRRARESSRAAGAVSAARRSAARHGGRRLAMEEFEADDALAAAAQLAAQSKDVEQVIICTPTRI